MKKFLLMLSLFLLPTWAFADVSQEQAASMVEQRTQARVLSVQTVNEDGTVYYRIKVVNERGEVRVVYVNVRTGQVE